MNSGTASNFFFTEGMGIGSTKENNKSKWPYEQVKALGVYHTYDVKLLGEKNVIERLDSIKKEYLVLKRIIHGKLTITKSFLIPKFIFVCATTNTK